MWVRAHRAHKLSLFALYIVLAGGLAACASQAHPLASAPTAPAGALTGPTPPASAARVAPPARHIYYVATSGDDANPCSLAAPCASFRRATSLAAPGDVVLVQSGTYLLPNSVSAGAAQAAHFAFEQISAVGTPGQPITVSALGPVTITRQEPLTDLQQTMSLLQVWNSAYVTVSGFTIIGPKLQSGYNPADRPYGSDVVLRNTGSAGPGLILRNLTVTHVNNTCIKVQDDEPNASILDNTVSDCGTKGDTLDHGIYESGPNGLIAGNVISGTSGYGIHVYRTDQPVAGARILNNTVTGASQIGIYAGEPPVTIAGNVVYANGLGGIMVSSDDGSTAPGPPSTIIGNVIANNGDPANAGTAGLGFGNGRGGSALGHQLIANNTFYHNGGHELAVAGGLVTTAITVENNIFVGSPKPGSPDHVGVINVAPAAGSAIAHNLYVNLVPEVGNGPPLFGGGHSLSQVDPRFVDVSRGPLPDLRLSAQSPAIGAGTDVGLPYGGTAPDLGALCYHCIARSPYPIAQVTMRR